MVNRIDLKLYLTLMLWALVPSVYLLVRMNIVSINNVEINILGQMEWFDLIDEVIVTTLIVPLYYLLKKDKNDKSKNGMAFIISIGIYLLFTIIIIMRIRNIVSIMNAEYATEYLLLQSIALFIDFINKFSLLLSQ